MDVPVLAAIAISLGVALIAASYLTRNMNNAYRKALTDAESEKAAYQDLKAFYRQAIADHKSASDIALELFFRNDEPVEKKEEEEDGQEAESDTRDSNIQQERPG